MSQPFRQLLEEARPVREIPSLNLHDVLEESARVASQDCEADMAAIWLVSEASQELHLVASHPPRPPATPYSVESDTLAARVVREARPIAVDRLLAFSSTDRPQMNDMGMQACLGMPIVIGGRCLGALTLCHRRQRSFDEDYIARGMAITHGLAVSIEKANLYQEATQRISELSLLHEVGRAISESLELSQILDSCADRLASLLDASSCWVLLREGDALVGATASGGFKAEASKVRVEPGKGPSLALAALEARRPLVSTDAQNDPRVNQQLVERFEEKSILVVPMIHRGRAIGVLVFDDRRAQRLFTPGEIERAWLVAGQLAAAVDNARLYEDLKTSYAELALAQQQLVAQERLAAIGELAAVVAHEVRNPLGAVFNAVEALRRSVSDGGQSGMLLRVLSEESERISHIVDDLLDFSHPHPVVVTEVPLLRALDEAIAASITRPEIRVERRIAPGLQSVAADGRQLRQALVNLLHNAAQAMPDGGDVRIEAAPAERDGHAFVAITIADSGPGIDREARDRIFQPFFTTKATGTGLGLAVVRRVAEAHGGSIEVHNAAGGGAVFTLLLPVSEADKS
jgi:signal transduction histidine kinase